MAVLMWVSHAERPLKVDELRHALAVEIGSADLNTDNLPSIGTLLACCQGLVVVDKEASTIRLIHFTLQEYLRAHPELFGTAHSTIAETCLSYLNLPQIMALPAIPFLRLQDTPFLEYSSLYWGMHAKSDLSNCAKQLVLKLFDDYSNHVSAKILLKAQKDWYFSGNHSGKPHLFSGLHCASFLGIDEIAAELVEVEGCDINQIDSVGNTPLLWAALNGHERVVEVLLGRDDINPNKLDEDGLTPLWWAVWNGHVGVAELLLGRDDVNPYQQVDGSLTPLVWAIFNGHEGVVKLLLGRGDVDPDKPDEVGWTPLGLAAWRGNEGVVKILLARDDVDSDKPDNYGHTPLWWATECKHEEVASMLLRRSDANPAKRRKLG